MLRCNAPKPLSLLKRQGIPSVRSRPVEQLLARLLRREPGKVHAKRAYAGVHAPFILRGVVRESRSG